MLSRRTIFVISFLVASILHVLFFAAAPHVSLLYAYSAPERFLETFRITITEDFAPAPPESTPTLLMASRPGSVRDLLKRDESLLQPEDLEASLSDIPGLDQRVATDPVAREYDLARSDEQLRRVDAKIVEIAQEDARRNLEVPRRLVRPSSERLLQNGELPALRSSMAADEPLRFDLPARSLLAESMANREATIAMGMGALPPREEIVLEREPLETPAEPAPQVARVPLEQAVQKARQESPYVFIDDLVDIRLETYAAAGDSVGYFRLRVIPKEDQSIEVLPKDITFVIDASSSIPQFKLNKTVNGVVRALDYLRAQDMFNIVIFRETPELFQGQPVAATPENKAAAKSFLARVPSHGQTDVYNGILPVLHALPRGGVPAIVLVMSDGRPTTGIQDARAIINGLTTDNNHVHSIYAFGGGNTVNRYLLDLLAYRNKGEAHVAEQVERIDEELPRFAARLADPLLVNLRANFSGIDVAELAPSLIPDFYKGQVVTIYGSYKISGVKEFVVRLTGRALDQKKELVFRADLAQATVGDREIARNWAFQKSYDIIGEISRVGAQPELVTALRQLSQQFNIRTAYAE